MGAHSRFSPSAAHRWAACPGSIKLIEALPHDLQNTTSAAAEEGTLAHEVAEKVLKGLDVDRHDPEMVKHARDYAQYVYSLIIDGPRDSEVLVEKRLDFSDVIPDGFGTADAIVLAVDEALGLRTLHVVDYKYGTGVVVEAIDNPQLEIYGWGAMRQFAWFKPDVIFTHIFQPRRGHISQAKYTPKELTNKGSYFAEQAQEALKVDAPLVPGEKQCRWCPAAAHCPVRRDEMLKLAQEEFAAEPLDGAQVSKLFSRIGEFRDWLTALEEAAHRLAAKAELPGFKMVEGRRPPRRWVKNDTEVIASLLLLGCDHDAIAPRKLITPAQVQKLVDKPLFSEISSALITEPEGKPVIAPVSDRRPAVVLTDGSEFETETP